jgi:DNA repair protein RecN (Recombination protein N)
MLQLLHIENIAVIEKADIEFGGGFNVLTGETGAGKSIVIDALSAVIGARTSRELIRTGAESAMVTAVFTNENANVWCAENGVEDDEGKLFLMRRISADGKNTCRVNGCPVSVSQLKELGGLLIDIHGQNDGLRLLDEATHIRYLDSFGCLTDGRASYGQLYAKLHETLKEINDLTLSENEKERYVNQLKMQIAELESARITVGEYEEKSARRELLKNAVKLTEAVERAFVAMYGDDETDGTVALLSEAEEGVGYAARYVESLQPLTEKLSGLRYAAQDALDELMDFKGGLDFSPDELDSLESRLDLLRRLMRKYGESEKKLLECLEQSKQDLDDIEYAEERLCRLEKNLEKQIDAAKTGAKILSDQRKQAACELEKRIKAELNQLSMPGVRFEVEFDETGGSYGLDETGCDKVRFLLSANAGEKPGRISSIASGGELSRIMLALKNVLTENDEIDTLVFDEIDAGVSGIAAQRVGEKLSSLARRRQVLCVTHLPQIAAMADIHFSIEKSEINGRTFTYVNSLDEDGRMHEIARLTGGDNITLTALANAAELLQNANAYKQTQM